MNIRINTLDSVKDFVAICSKYQDSDIDVKQGRHIVDGKSVLGVFSLNLVEPVSVIIDSENENSKIGFYNNIQKWKVMEAV